MSAIRGKTQTVKCKCCKLPFIARVADIKRGWGKFCSKSCKAIRQTQRTGYAGPNGDQSGNGFANKDRDGCFQMSAADLAGGGYGDADWNTPFGDGKLVMDRIAGPGGMLQIGSDLK